MDDFIPVSTDIEYADVQAPINESAAGTGPPITIADKGPLEYWDLSLDEAVQLALHNSTVLRDLGGTILTQPDTMRTVYTPALAETDGQFGVDAALSAFDASFSTDFFFENNNRALNNQFFGGGVRTLDQDLATSNTEVTKTSATGSEFTMRQNIEYDRNNSPGNLFLDGAFQVQLEGEFRHPLLRGGGLDYNRIAGPGAEPGVFNGVLIARINTDISIADFEIGIRNIISDAENSYWELYYAYRDLDARVATRDRALALWRAVHARSVVGGQGGEAKNEALAREQYYRLAEDVQNSLTGRVIQKTRTDTFRAFGGVHVNERRLRLALGIPITDGRLIRPSNEPVTAKVVFDWEEVMCDALNGRPELRRQQWKIKQAELQLLASRNFLLPNFDVVGLYRFRGFGNNLIDSESDGFVNDPMNPGQPLPGSEGFQNAYENLLDGDFQEFNLGFEFSYPIGFRQAHAQIRNAQLLLAREKAVLNAQEREIVHDLSVWIAEVERSYVVAQTSYNRRQAAREQLDALEAEYSVSRETNTLDLVLQAQRRFVDAETAFYRSLAEYNFAVKQVHYEKGTLLEYNGIALSEGAWPQNAYRDAAELAHRRVPRVRGMSYVFKQPPLVSAGVLAPGVPQSPYPTEAGFDRVVTPDQFELPSVPGLQYHEVEGDAIIESVEPVMPQAGFDAIDPKSSSRQALANTTKPDSATRPLLAGEQSAKPQSGKPQASPFAPPIPAQQEAGPMQSPLVMRPPVSAPAQAPTAQASRELPPVIDMKTYKSRLSPSRAAALQAAQASLANEYQVEQQRQSKVSAVRERLEAARVVPVSRQNGDIRRLPAGEFDYEQPAPPITSQRPSYSAPVTQSTVPGGAFGAPPLPRSVTAQRELPPMSSQSGLRYPVRNAGGESSDGSQVQAASAEKPVAESARLQQPAASAPVTRPTTAAPKSASPVQRPAAQPAPQSNSWNPAKWRLFGTSVPQQPAPAPTQPRPTYSVPAGNQPIPASAMPAGGFDR